MGAAWLHDLPAVLRAAGLTVDTYDGWEWRSRSSGGYDAVLSVQVHHTASNTTPANDMAYMWRNSPDEPIGAIYLARDGRITVGAAGATNTSGKGGPLAQSKGVIPLDSANRYVISIEAANAGTGEAWPRAQQDAYVKMCSALFRNYGLSIGDVHAHFEWTTRKVDPAGNSNYATGSNKWNMDQFRSDVLLSGSTPPPTIPPGDDMIHAIQPFRNSDTRPFGGNGIVGEARFGLSPTVFPANTVAVAMNIAVIEPTDAGFCTVWPSGPRPDTSCVNYLKGGATNGAVVVGIHDMGFQIYLHTRAHVACDVTAYWTA